MSGPPRGACVWLTGRSGAGKSTVTAALLPMLEAAGRTVTVLDTVPQLAKTSGERTSEGKLMRKAFVASEVARHGGLAICVTVSARRSVREQARALVGPQSFVEVYFDAGPDLAQQRRRARGSTRSVAKRLRDVLRPVARVVSARYRGGYEPPAAPDVTIDAARQAPADSARAIFDVLVSRGFVVSRG